MDKDNINLQEFIEAYDKLSLKDKRKELGREITELNLVIKKLLNDFSIKNFDNDLSCFDNLYDGNLIETEYLTILYKHIIDIKELLGIYFNETIFLDSINK